MVPFVYQVNLLYFIFVGLFWFCLWGYIYVYIQSHFLLLFNFWFPLFTRSIYCTLFLLDCFDFAYGGIYMCIFSHTFYCCYKPLYLCWIFAILWSFPVFLPFFFLLPYSPFFKKSFLFFIILTFNFLKPIIFLHLFLC